MAETQRPQNKRYLQGQAQPGDGRGRNGHVGMKAVERHLNIRGEDRHEQNGGCGRAEPPRARDGEQRRADEFADAAGGDDRSGMGAERRGHNAAIRAGYNEMQDAGPADKETESEERKACAAAHRHFLTPNPSPSP